jgi:hypothetical protein
MYKSILYVKIRLLQRQDARGGGKETRARA